jgi:ADP-heptose:LPS heptosyltransferase
MPFALAKLTDLLRAIRDVVWWFWDSLIDRLCPSQKQCNGALFVKLDAIGDFILFYGFLVQYKAANHQEPLYIVCSHELASLVQSTNIFSKIIPVKRRAFIRNPLYRAGIFYKLHQLGARRAIQANFTRHFIWGDAVTLRSGASEKIAHKGSLSLNGWRRRWADKSYSSLVSRNESSGHEFEFNCDLMRFLGLPEVESKVARLPIMQPEMPSRLKFTGPYFVIFPGAGKVRRQWPVERFAQLGGLIAEKYGWKMLICGAPSEYELGQSLLRSAGCEGLNLCGQTNLLEFCELVREAELLVGNDSGAVHVAAAVGTLSFCLLGGGHFNRFLPYPDSVAGAHPYVIYEEMPCYGCDWVCTHQQADLTQFYPCIQNISLRHTLEVIESNVSVN